MSVELPLHDWIKDINLTVTFVAILYYSGDVQAAGFGCHESFFLRYWHVVVFIMVYAQYMHINEL